MLPRWGIGSVEALFLCFTLLISARTAAAFQRDEYILANEADKLSKIDPNVRSLVEGMRKPHNSSTYIAVAIDKLLINKPPEPCCAVRKTPNCEVCTYACRFIVFDASLEERVFIDHRFDCSVDTTGSKIQIPLLKALSASKYYVRFEVFTKYGDQLISGQSTLYAENMAHSPESRIITINLNDRYNIDFNVSLTCMEGFVGPNCNVSCPPPKPGDHYRCTNAGRFCLPGYMGSDCEAPVCTNGCVKGKCIGPNICGCEDGWMGDRCELCKVKPGCRHGYCDKQPYECKCRAGFDGEFCNFPTRPTRLDPQTPSTDKNESTYLTLSILTIVLLVICAALLLIVLLLALRTSNIRWPFRKTSSNAKVRHADALPSEI